MGGLKKNRKSASNCWNNDIPLVNFLSVVLDAAQAISEKCDVGGEEQARLNDILNRVFGHLARAIKNFSAK